MKNHNIEYTLANVVSPEVDLEEYLDKKMEHFFPEAGRWGSSCYRRPNDLSRNYLPCHLNDNGWLAKMIIKYCNMDDRKYKKVLDYVKTSEVFARKKKEYALRVVEWQINFIVNGGEGYCLKKQHGDECWVFYDNCDRIFRWAVIDTLESIGMPRNVIEEGLEIYSDNWRNRYIERAFRNKYEPVRYKILGNDNGIEHNKVNEEFKKAWIAARKYEYYQVHHELVDLYGKVEPEMKMSDDEYRKLKEFVNAESDKRIMELNASDDKNDNNQSSLIEENNLQEKSFVKRLKSRFKRKR